MLFIYSLRCNWIGLQHNKTVRQILLECGLGSGGAQAERVISSPISVPINTFVSCSHARNTDTSAVWFTKNKETMEEGNMGM